MAGAKAAARRVLVVDDDPEMRRLLADFLRQEGFRVDLAAEADEALRRVAQEGARYEGVLLDNNLPGETGLEVLPRLRDLLPGVPVFLITTFGDHRTRHAALARGAYEVLRKPFGLDDLLALLRRALDGPAATWSGGEDDPAGEG